MGISVKSNPTCSKQLWSLTGSVALSGVSQQRWADKSFLLCKETMDGWDTAWSQATHSAENLAFSAFLLCYLERRTLSAALSAGLRCMCLKLLEIITLFPSPLPLSHVLFRERGIREAGGCCEGSGARCRDVTLQYKFFLYPACPCWVGRIPL